MGTRFGGYHVLPGEQVTNFFMVFSRFDFALKRGGFVLGNVGGRAEANWDVFANALGIEFFNTVRLVPEVGIFFNNPPKKLMVMEDGSADFADAEPPTSSAELFVTVRRVRNNLFHGEKFWVGERDENLMNAALLVLDLAFNACTNIPACAGVPLAFRESRVKPH